MTAVFELPELPSAGREKTGVRQWAAVTPLHAVASERPPNSPGAILRTREVMHCTNYAMVFTAGISLHIALSL